MVLIVTTTSTIFARKMIIHHVPLALAALHGAGSSGGSQTFARLIYIFCQRAGKEPLDIFSAHVKTPHVFLIPALTF